MSIHRAEISAILTRWLDRYSPPAAIKDNARALQDEAEALLAVLIRFAPRGENAEPGPWVRYALDRMEYQMKTRAWPTKGELGAVCSNIKKEAPKAAPEDDGVDRSSEAITGRKMAKGEPVGEHWLYGTLACALIAGRHVDKATMDAYRSGAYFARKEFYGEAAAKAWEEEAKRRHEEARLAFRDKAPPARRGSQPVQVNRMNENHLIDGFAE